MNGFVQDYTISATAVLVKAKQKEKVKEITIPLHGIADVKYTKGDTNIVFEKITVNTENIRFKESEEADTFYKKINNEWFNLIL